MSGKAKKLKRFLIDKFRALFQILLVLSWGFAVLLYLSYLGGLIFGTVTIEFPWNILVAVLGAVLIFAYSLLALFLGGIAQ